MLGEAPGAPGVASSVIKHDQLQTFQKLGLDQAVNLAPGVSSTLEANGRRNESDIFVRGFGRWQVPLMVDGVRIYLPADNRLDLARFLTTDIAAIQIQKGYASVLDGPGAMGGAINLVTMSPTKPLQVEGGISAGGRDVEGWSAYAMVGTRQPTYLRDGQCDAHRPRFVVAVQQLPAHRELAPARRPAPRVRQRGLAGQCEARLHPDAHQRVHPELHEAIGREGRAAERLQQSPRAAEELLALAVVGRPEPVARHHHATRPDVGT